MNNHISAERDTLEPQQSDDCFRDDSDTIEHAKRQFWRAVQYDEYCELELPNGYTVIHL